MSNEGNPPNSNTTPPDPIDSGDNGSNYLGRESRASHVAAGRRLFRYLNVEEWEEYRLIISTFADTYFMEFSPEDVEARLQERGGGIPLGTIDKRLSKLCEWGNLCLSADSGTPSSIEDYYRRRNRYLITDAGQRVHSSVEGLLSTIDEVRDISVGRLRALLLALEALSHVDPHSEPPERLGEMVSAVFDPYDTFTQEITVFFASLNQWQRRYDLTQEEFSLFARVLIDYVTEKLEEIALQCRPIGDRLVDMEDAIPFIVDRARFGLAERVDDAGMGRVIAVTRAAGARLDDWDNVRRWFISQPGVPSKMESARHQAIAAIQTLTRNLVRLSRRGMNASSRRHDWIRLATFLQAASASDASTLFNAACGLFPARHLGIPSEDASDPMTATTSWWDAPRADVPITLRTRGDVAVRGKASPMPDRHRETELVRMRRQVTQRQHDAVDREVATSIGSESVDIHPLSAAGLARVEELVGRTLPQMTKDVATWTTHDRELECRLERTPGTHTELHSPDGTLTLWNLTLTITHTATAHTEGQLKRHDGAAALPPVTTLELIDG